jgi:hypothetical protein
MKVCAVDLKASDAIICLMSLSNGLYNLHECRVKRFTIADASSTEQLRKFQFDFSKLMADYQVEHIVIRERMTKGKFAGGAVSFKLEAAIQLADSLNVSLLSPSKIKDIIKKSRVKLSFEETGLKQFQEQAFMAGFAYLEQI